MEDTGTCQLKLIGGPAEIVEDLQRP